MLLLRPPVYHFIDIQNFNPHASFPAFQFLNGSHRFLKLRTPSQHRTHWPTRGRPSDRISSSLLAPLPSRTTSFTAPCELGFLFSRSSLMVPLMRFICRP